MSLGSPDAVLPTSPQPEDATSAAETADVQSSRLTPSPWFTGPSAQRSGDVPPPAERAEAARTAETSRAKETVSTRVQSSSKASQVQRRVASIVAASRRLDSSPLVGFSARQARPSAGRKIAAEVRVRRRLLGYAPSAPAQVVVVTEDPPSATAPDVTPASPAPPRPAGLPSIFSPGMRAVQQPTRAASAAPIRQESGRQESGRQESGRQEPGRQVVRRQVVRRQAGGSVDRPLERLTNRAQWQSMPASPLLGERQRTTPTLARRRPRLQTSADGVILAAPRSEVDPIQEAVLTDALGMRVRPSQ